MKRILGLIAALAMLQVSVPAYADPPAYAKTVSACGTPGSSPVVGNPQAVTIDPNGVLCTSSSGGGGGGGTSSNFGSAFPTPGTAAGFNDGTNMQGARVFDTDTGAGTEYTQGAVIRLPGSGGSVAGGTATNPVRTDPTGTTTQPVSGTVTANLGTLGGAATAAKQPALGTAGSASTDVITVQGIASGVAQPISGSLTNISGTISLPTGASTSALQGAQGTGSTYNPPSGGSGEIGYLSGIYAAAISTTAVASAPQAQTTGGCTPYGFTSAASTNSTLISTGAHTICSLSAINTTATLYYLRVYDAAGAPTCSSATGFLFSLPIPASTTGAGAALPLGPFGLLISSGLGFCLTGGGSSTDNTNAATGVYLIAGYK